MLNQIEKINSFWKIESEYFFMNRNALIHIHTVNDAHNLTVENTRAPEQPAHVGCTVFNKR